MAAAQHINVSTYQRIFIFFVALLSAFFVPLQAQELRGRVTSEGKAVEFANVGVVSARTPYGGITDGRGYYRFTVRERDSVTVRISCTGYEPQEVRLLLVGSEVRTLDIELRRSATELEVVEVVRCPAEPDVEVTVLCGLPKGDRTDYIIQKCVEAGAHEILFFKNLRSAGAQDIQHVLYVR